MFRPGNGMTGEKDECNSLTLLIIIQLIYIDWLFLLILISTEMNWRWIQNEGSNLGPMSGWVRNGNKSHLNGFVWSVMGHCICYFQHSINHWWFWWFWWWCSTHHHRRHHHHRHHDLSWQTHFYKTWLKDHPRLHSGLNEWTNEMNFIRSFISFIHSFIQSFIHSVIYSFIHSFIHSLIRSFLRSVSQSVTRHQSIIPPRPNNIELPNLILYLLYIDIEDLVTCL